ncbi:unnamed protein product [Mytilus coruscus]|uniref:Endonuclease/exonuclease/phosphatase domain-containing protein n=1 Tax=Mytilus coruscus TaxID=42192 RepID=A0A6J8B3Y5_MYTCO|nr:unnamed protein product [Mytilus coruscus]
MSLDVFHPSLDDSIDAAFCFDQTLKFVTFNATSFETENTDINATVSAVSALYFLIGTAKTSALVRKLPAETEHRVGEFYRNSKKDNLHSDEVFKCFQKECTFIHLNARSLLTKIHELQTIAFKTKAAVISVTETWFDETITNTEANIAGYTILRKDRNICGGGVCMYIKENLAFTTMNLDEINNNDEFLCIELLLPKSKPIFVGTCYRPPQNCNFVEKFENILLGDLNICFKDQSGSLYKSLNELLKLFNLSQIIKEPTRITEFTASVIDHILCNNTEKISQSGVLNIGFSDHCMI